MAGWACPACLSVVSDVPRQVGQAGGVVKPEVCPTRGVAAAGEAPGVTPHSPLHVCGLPGTSILNLFASLHYCNKLGPAVDLPMEASASAPEPLQVSRLTCRFAGQTGGPVDLAAFFASASTA